MYSLKTYSGVQRARKESEEFFLKFPRRFTYGFKSIDTTGDYLYYCKNAKHCFAAQYLEDCAYCQFVSAKPTRNCYDLCEWGENAEFVYDAITVGRNVSNIRFCSGAHNDVRNIEYSMYIVGSHDMFGCIGQRKRSYCILNKQYTKEEYENLRLEIIENMKNNPYKDEKGRVWSYGEYFPYELSLFDYNESFAIQYFPMTEHEANLFAFRWRTAARTMYEITLEARNLPDSIDDVTDKILYEVIGCITCNKAYRIIKQELDMLRRFTLPVPRMCPDCRHFARKQQINVPKFYQRACMCTNTNHKHGDRCTNAFETSYAPDRPEIVYCESCYQREVS